MSEASMSDWLLDAVIEVRTDYCTSDFELPWQMREERNILGIGFVISGRKIITLAHFVVNIAATVKIKKRTCDDSYIARIVEIAHECDLAMLSVADETFWKGSQTLELGRDLGLQERLLLIGYGEEGMCMTFGFSRRCLCSRPSKPMVFFPCSKHRLTSRHKS